MPEVPAPDARQPAQDTDTLIDVHLRRIKTRAECLAAFAPGEPSAHAVIRNADTLDRVRHIAELLAEAVNLMPIDPDWLHGRTVPPVEAKPRRGLSGAGHADEVMYPGQDDQVLLQKMEDERNGR